jgi:nitrogen-specific signal transduction histidine kinase/CheY-like chemotaxis protein
MRLAATLLCGVLARARADAHQRAVERRMQDAQKLESLGVLAGGIAHDFNNLLTAILGNASLLRAEIGDVDGVTEAVEQIETASRRAAELCRQMLAYAGRGRFALQLIDLNMLLHDMQAPLEVTIPKTAKLELALATSIPAVLADESQIRQLVMNLVFNAAEALAEGVGAITLHTGIAECTAEDLARTVFSPQLPGGRYVSLRVTDTGHGMSPETAARIFDPFFSTRFTGRGLGLAAVVGIVRSHKGALRVSSTVGSGSTFELLLPAQDGAPALPPESISPSTHASQGKWRTTGTALVIDDERGVRDLVRSVLQRSGMTILEADNGERGIATFDELGEDVRIVLVDLTMPGLDGRETLAAIRERRPDIPAVLMSGYSPADLINSASHAFLQKPFTPAALRSVVKRLLGE